MSIFRSLAKRISYYQFPAYLRTASNFVANIYGLIVTIAFVPLYINYLGVEAYGIIGAFNGITAFLWLFDFGISTNINRELSKFDEQKNPRDLIDLKRTLEIACFLLSGLILLFLIGFIAFLSFYWFTSATFTPLFLLTILAILALSLVLQFPVAFYTSGLLGLNQHVTVNIINVLFNTIKCIGAYITVIYSDDKIRAFLIFQLAVTLAQALILKVALTKYTIVDGYKGRFRFEILKQLKRFTSELFANSVVIMLLTQSDKIILSRILTLEDFGYYMLAYNIAAMTVGLFSNSITNVIFPSFSKLVSKGNLEGLMKNFHLSSQLMAWGMVSITTTLAFFPQDILLIWARNPQVAEKTSFLLSLWAIGTGLNILCLIPYYLQLAFGRSNISFRFNIVALFINVPALIISSNLFGGKGAVICWVILNAVYLFTFVPVIRNSFLSFSLKDWYLKDVGKVVLVGVSISFIFYRFFPRGSTHLSLLALIGASFLTVACVTFFITELPKYVFEYNLMYKLRRRTQ